MKFKQHICPFGNLKKKKYMMIIFPSVCFSLSPFLCFASDNAAGTVAYKKYEYCLDWGDV